MAKKQPTARDQHKRKIVLRARRIIRECDQAIRDVEYWNSLNPRKKPIDAEEFKLFRQHAQRTIDQLGRK